MHFQPIFVFSIFVMLLFACQSASQNQANSEDEIFQYLPEGAISFEELSFATPEVKSQTLLKLIKNTTSDLDWFKNYVIENSENGEIPYHPKLGITKKEYEAFIEDIQKRKLVTIGTGEITIEKEGGIISFSSENSAYAVFNSLKIDAKNLSAKWRDFDIETYSKIQANERQLVKFYGHKWKHNGPDLSMKEALQASKTMEFNIGKLLEEESLLLRLTIRIIENGRRIISEEKVLKLKIG